MCEPDNIRYSFLVEWYDAEASLLRPYYLFYFPVDGSIELFDPKYGRLFLKRMVVPGVTVDQLHEGGTLHIYGRQMHLRCFGDDYTRKNLGVIRQRTFAMVNACSMGDVVCGIYANGFIISKLKMTHNSGDSPVKCGTGGTSLAMELVAENAVARWLCLCNSTFKAVHASESPEAAARELAHFFPDACGGRCGMGVASFCNNTCCVVLPHVIKECKLGEVMKAIESGGFCISAAQMFYMEDANAEEFYEVYKGVVPEYSAMVSHLVSGPCVAMEITGRDNVPDRFRKFCGPRDPEMARHLRPDSLRARFGVNRVCMGVHCSDLPEDGSLEVDYFFKILQ